MATTCQAASSAGLEAVGGFLKAQSGKVPPKMAQECGRGDPPGLKGDDSVDVDDWEEGGALLNLLGGARKRWTSLDPDDYMSVAATLHPSPTGTPARNMLFGRGLGASTWDCGVPGSLKSSSVDALLFLIEMNGAPQPETAPTAAPANCRLPRGQRENNEGEDIFDMDISVETSPDKVSKRASQSSIPLGAHKASPRHVGAQRRAGDAAAMQQESEISGPGTDLDSLLEVRARREMWRLNPEEIVLEEKLGEGDCAVVHKARWRSMAVVSKQLREVNEYSSIDSMPGKSPATAFSCLSAERARADLANEVHILSHLRHP
jgi:hypothetical protein